MWHTEIHASLIIFVLFILRPWPTPALVGKPRRGFCRGGAELAATSCGRGTLYWCCYCCFRCCCCYRCCGCYCCCSVDDATAVFAAAAAVIGADVAIVVSLLMMLLLSSLLMLLFLLEVLRLLQMLFYLWDRISLHYYQVRYYKTLNHINRTQWIHSFCLAVIDDFDVCRLLCLQTYFMKETCDDALSDFVKVFCQLIKRQRG